MAQSLLAAARDVDRDSADSSTLTLVPRAAPPSPVPSIAVLTRALRLALLPGMSQAKAARRVGISLAALRRARQTITVHLDRDDLILAALTDNGTRTTGPIGDLAALARWLDAVNHDGSDAATIARDLDRLAHAGRITRDGDHFVLLGDWP